MATPSPQLKSITKLAGQRVLLLGGTSGIGFAVAAAALEHGASVIVSSSQLTNVENAISRLKISYPTDDFHRRIYGFTCDLSKSDKLEENLLTLLKQSTTMDGEQTLLDHVVFTAGDKLNIKPIQQVTVDYIKEVANVRFLAPLILAKLVGQFIRPSHTSSVTLTGGSVTSKPVPCWSTVIAYAGAVEIMTRALAVDLAPIRFNCVLPGPVHTELLENSVPTEALDGLLEQYAELTLVGQVGKLEDVAEAYIYAMKDNFCTGSSIQTNGGVVLKILINVYR